MAGQIFRIGHMGTSIERREVDLLLRATEDALRHAGIALPEGADLADIWAEVSG